MRKTLCASVLLLALCVPALAGDTMNPPAPVNYSDSTSANQSSSVRRAGCRVGTEAPDHSADNFAAAALTVLGSVLALL